MYVKPVTGIVGCLAFAGGRCDCCGRLAWRRTQ